MIIETNLKETITFINRQCVQINMPNTYTLKVSNLGHAPRQQAKKGKFDRQQQDQPTGD